MGQKIALYAVILGIVCCSLAHGGNIDCVKYLHFGDNKICLKILKETSPALVAEINDTIYYASTTHENYSKVKFEYNDKTYSIFNHDDIEYELIHWLSGTDALDGGLWRDRVAIDGAMDFKNHGCTWNDAHDGYYSADGLSEYFQTISVPKLDFGTDWYVEITAQVGEPLGITCFIVDLCSVRGMKNTYNADAFAVRNNGGFYTNTKIGDNYNTAVTSVAAPGYTFGDKAIFTFGSSTYSDAQSRQFITFNGNRYYSRSYDTVQWNRWDNYFYLFRGAANNEGDGKKYQCGPTTIYDIKVWRRKIKQ